MAIVQHSTSPLIMLLLCSFYCIFLNSKQLSMENGEFSFWCNFPGALFLCHGSVLEGTDNNRDGCVTLQLCNPTASLSSFCHQLCSRSCFASLPLSAIGCYLSRLFTEKKALRTRRRAGPCSLYVNWPHRGQQSCC